ncbi:hypothetical protein [Streptomyces werraensis]|uniref:hypothetical protein n=1 Tax=Streptomyces werraensis TaxID=68284 RepID=UPI0036CB9147
MALSVRLAAVGMAATALALSAGVAHAQEAPLVSVLDGTSVLDEAALAPNVSPGVALICAQNGQQGKGNIIGGDLTQSCSQTATQTNTGGNGGGNGGGGVTGAQRVAGPGVTIPPGGFGESDAICPEGQIATGGGFDSSEPGDAEPGGFRVTNNEPVTVLGEQEPTSWSVAGHNESDGDVFLRAWAVCVDAAE